MFKKRAKGAEIILALVAEKARAGPEFNTWFICIFYFVTLRVINLFFYTKLFSKYNTIVINIIIQ
jgi:threonine/homoserine efflux transporter RhtA